MQKRHKDRQWYFNELANTSRSFYIDYVKQFISLSPSTHILEIGCGEGGNLLPFAELGCKVTGIDRAASRIHQAETFFTASGYKGEFTTTDFFNFSSASRYQLILIHDVIEHISNKEEFFRCLSPLLAKGGIIFWGFPSWQMPFGGHQQICHNRFVSSLPFIHLCPGILYRFLWNTIMYRRIIRHQTLPHDQRHLWTTCWKVWIRNNRQTIMVHQPTLPTKVPSAATKIISCTGTVKIYQKLLQHLLFLYNAPPWASWLRQPIYTTFMFIPTL